MNKLIDNRKVACDTLSERGVDLALFAIWHDARFVEDRIRTKLAETFQIVADLEVVWSKENFHINSQRLYECVIPSQKFRHEIISSHAEKIGCRKFRLIVVRDVAPEYAYRQSISGKIELSNINVVRCKRLFRTWIDKPYRIHSSNNISEFLFQSALIFGPEVLKGFLSGEVAEFTILEKDLEGADGWESWEEAFDVLKFCSEFLVLRNYSNLPYSESDDIDVLCDDYQRLASALNVSQFSEIGKPYKGKVRVALIEIPIDIRFVGDGYYDLRWESDMLSTREEWKNYYIPRLDHSFFSLLYHAKVHKKNVKAGYVVCLAEWAEALNFDWYQSPDDINIDDNAGSILNGYMCANKYYFSVPLDDGVFLNKKIKILLPTYFADIKLSLRIRQSVKNFIFPYIKKYLPRYVKILIKKFFFIRRSV